LRKSMETIPPDWSYAAATAMPVQPVIHVRPRI
jgi:hypothetical protein